MKKKFGDKKGVSPVVATVLLITIAIIVVVIIFIWASRSIGDVGTKNNTPLDQVCQNLNVDITVSTTSVSITNRESTYALEGVVLKDDSGALYTCTGDAIPPGGSGNIPLSSCESASDVVSAIPVLKDDNGNLYNCENDEIDVN